MDSIEAQYTILGFKQNEKQQLKRLPNPWRVYGSSSFRREDEEVCSNVKQQLVRVQNKESAARWQLLFYNDNVFELPLAKQTKKEILISNSLLEIFDRYLLAKNLFVKETV
jgi:hypothetical protein